MNESEQSMTYRKAIQQTSKPGRVVVPGQIQTIPVYGLGGVRCRGCMILIQSFIWNVGTCWLDIPKENGKTRPIGIPPISDRIAQMLVKDILEPIVDPHFHDDSYGYRPGKSAHDAIAKARQRCWRDNWVLDMDIRGFFDAIDHSLVMKAASYFTNNPWVLLYIKDGWKQM